jgi:uncharacterized membrane protein YheB (UPF0754 family)
METWRLFLIPVIGFIIGYFTNYLAIKMLFYPRKKILGFRGVLPSRRLVLSRKISESAISVLPEQIRKIKKIPIIGEVILGIIRKSIEKEINSLDDKELEKLILNVAKKELSFITWIGGLIGLIIGLVQVLVIVL